MREKLSSQRSNHVGEFALTLGIGAALCVFLPVVGDYVATPLAVLAVALGFVGIRQHEADPTSRVAPAVIGLLLGAAALLIVGLLFAITHLRP